MKIIVNQNINILIVIFILFIAGCTYPQVNESKAINYMDNNKDNIVNIEPKTNKTVSDLPYSQGKSFSNLDEYLLFLKERGKHDIPYYKEISPGKFQKITGRGFDAKTAPIFTREELEMRFGFSSN